MSASTSTSEPVQLERRENGVAVLTLNRPDRLNALNGPLLDQLRTQISTLDAEPEIRAFLIVGAARADGRPCFSAGVDVQAFAEQQGVTNEQGCGLTDQLDDLLTPSIAVIDGICTTGGAEIALACDFRLVGEAAQISDWHLKKLGIGIGSWGGPVRWAREVGVTRAKEIMLTGRVIDGEEAARIGFATGVYPSEDLMNEALAMADTIAEMDPDGVRLLLANLDRIGDMSRDQGLRWAQLSADWLGVGVREDQLKDRVLG